MAMRRATWFETLAPLLGVVACGGDAFTSVPGSQDGGAGDGGASGSSGASHAAGGQSGGGGSPAAGGLSGTGAVVGGGGVPTGPLSEADFRAALTSTYCDLLVSCCTSSGIVLDHEKCDSFISNASGTSAMGRPGTYTYDANQAAECLDAVRTSLGACTSFPNAVSPCAGVYQGTLPPGAPCQASVECDRGVADASVSCDSGGDGGKVCSRKSRGVKGEACTESCRQQGPITYCQGSGISSDDRVQCFANDGLYCSSGFCSAQLPLGSSCTETAACAGEATCRLQDHVCVALGSEGATCATNSDCVSTAYCASSVCTAKLPEGANCSSSNECTNGLCTSGKCSGSNAGISLVCSVIQSGGFPTPAPPPPMP